MINQPIVIIGDSFQQVWRESALFLRANSWEIRNLVVQIQNPSALDAHFHNTFDSFSSSNGLLGPKHVAYTIFPHRLYAKRGSASAVFEAYNRKDGLYERLHRRRGEWGTYFRRMTWYETVKGVQNQIENIIGAITDRDNIYRAAYTIVIQKPGGETIRTLGGPCLNYVAVQIEPIGSGISLGLLAVYRNHDFLIRAYGNYWGLCNLLCFFAQETNAEPGPLTCVSSRAYVPSHKRQLADLLDTI